MAVLRMSKDGRAEKSLLHFLHYLPPCRAYAERSHGWRFCECPRMDWHLFHATRITQNYKTPARYKRHLKGYPKGHEVDYPAAEIHRLGR